MKTIKDLTSKHINKIYSIIVRRDCTAGRIEWTDEKDFVFAVFKTEECTSDDRYDIIEYGLQINDDLRIDHVWYWVSKKGSATDYQPLYNHNEITLYLIKEGFIEIEEINKLKEVINRKNMYIDALKR